jgi:pilus assembly protein CpaE
VVRATDPEVLLLDLRDWERVAGVAPQLAQLGLRALPVGFLGDWTPEQQVRFGRAGISDLLREPFSPGELVRTVYEGLHRASPITNRNILAFLPAKAGSGASTVGLHTAAALANEFQRSVLLVEGDRRSGVLSILLNRETPRGVAGALLEAGELTDLSWRNYYEKVSGFDVLLADPARRGPLPTWAQFYQLLRFVQSRYEFVLADLPEVVNEATAEVVRNARGVVVVCTPELPSIKMAAIRCAELEECEVPPERIHVVLNRFERDGLRVEDAEAALGRPVFATLPNDYARLRDAMLESRVAPEDSPLGKGSRALAEKLGGLPEGSQKHGRFSLLQKLGRMME